MLDLTKDKRVKYPFKTMQVGDVFVIKCCLLKTVKAAHRLRCAAQMSKKITGQRSYTTTVEGNLITLTRTK